MDLGNLGMCGIVGLFNRNLQPVNANLLRRMGDAIAHRGPDGEGYLVEGALGLGHRRLSIIDLSDGGAQPLTSPSGRWTIVYNGELYNYIELREEMRSKGELFRTESDTEVFLRALELWGMKALERFNGMFAFAALDRSQNTLYLARDRFGVKPLYYSVARDGTLGFASEIKALFAHDSFSGQISPSGLSEYLTFMNFISDQTLFKGVFLLPAGNFSAIQLDSKLSPSSQLVHIPFWDFRFTGVGAVKNERELIEELEESFSLAVKRQLISDVGVSSYLSGGVDSGSITAVAARERGRMRSFTCAFDTENTGADSIFDERSAAELMSREFNTEHYEIILKHSDFEHCFAELVHQLEEPRVGQSYPNYMVAGLASRFEKVCLSGTGGDELFGGYPWRYFHGLPTDGSNPKSFDQYAKQYFTYWRRIMKTDSALKTLLDPVWDEAKDFDPFEAFLGVFPEEARSAKNRDDILNWALYFEAKTFLNGLLIVEDKISMAHSLETRVPFLDNDLVDLACRIPISAKLDTTASAKGGRRSDGKRILRKMMSNLVPPEIYNRDKQGFSAPDASWFRNQSRPFIESHLEDANLPLYNLIDHKTVTSIVEDHMHEKNDARILLWAFMSLGELSRTYAL